MTYCKFLSILAIGILAFCFEWAFLFNRFPQLARNERSGLEECGRLFLFVNSGRNKPVQLEISSETGYFQTSYISERFRRNFRLVSGAARRESRVAVVCARLESSEDGMF